MRNLGLYVDPQNLQVKIKQVRTGSRSDFSDGIKIAVVVRQSQESDAFITWDSENDVEIKSFDHDHANNPQVFWDQDGNPYSIEKDTIYFAEQGVRIKCYDVEEP
jgi:predicted secreted protein